MRLSILHEDKEIARLRQEILALKKAATETVEIALTLTRNIARKAKLAQTLEPQGDKPTDPDEIEQEFDARRKQLKEDMDLPKVSDYVAKLETRIQQLIDTGAQKKLEMENGNIKPETIKEILGPIMHDIYRARSTIQRLQEALKGNNISRLKEFLATKQANEPHSG